MEEEKNIKYFYTIPNFQNPSGITMSLEKRRQIMRWQTIWAQILECTSSPCLQTTIFCTTSRINFSTPTDEQLREGIRILGEIVREMV